MITSHLARLFYRRIALPQVHPLLSVLIVCMLTSTQSISLAQPDLDPRSISRNDATCDCIDAWIYLDRGFYDEGYTLPRFPFFEQSGALLDIKAPNQKCDSKSYLYDLLSGFLCNNYSATKPDSIVLIERISNNPSDSVLLLLGEKRKPTILDDTSIFKREIISQLSSLSVYEPYFRKWDQHALPFKPDPGKQFLFFIEYYQTDTSKIQRRLIHDKLVQLKKINRQFNDQVAAYLICMDCWMNERK